MPHLIGIYLRLQRAFAGPDGRLPVHIGHGAAAAGSLSDADAEAVGCRMQGRLDGDTPLPCKTAKCLLQLSL